MQCRSGEFNGRPHVQSAMAHEAPNTMGPWRPQSYSLVVSRPITVL